MKRSRTRVVFVGQFPPPINGLTFITSRLASALTDAGYEIAAVDIAGAVGRRSVFFHASRLAGTCRAMFSIVVNAILGKSRICYLTADGGLGLVYTVLVAGCARLSRSRIYIHHHSFSYIVRRRILMDLLLILSGSNAIHIFLSSRMARDLSKRYGRSINSLVLSNAAFVDCASSGDPSRKREGITIGLLSNLTADKGFYEFLNIIREAKQRALPIRGVLAGPIAGDSDRAALESLKRELGEYLDYRGPVYDGEKLRFLRDIDVFVFLTTYLNEAQPTVLFEAMANGIPVISYDRGSIRDQVRDGGHVFPQDVDGVSETLNVLRRYCDDPDALAAQGRTARAAFEDERRRSQRLVADLFGVSPTEVRGVR